MYTQDEQEMIEEKSLAIGQTLKAAREQANILLQDVADKTRLSLGHLSALEAGEFERLPGVGYIPGYIRNYCHAVGLDAEPYIASFKALANDVTKKPEYSFPVQALVPRVAGSMVAMFTVLVGLALYVGWTVLSYDQSPDSELIASSISQSDQPALLIESETEATGQAVQPASEAIVVEQSADQAPSSQLQLAAPREEIQTEFASSQLDSPKVATTVTVPEAVSSAQDARKSLSAFDSPIGSASQPNIDLTTDPTPTSVAALATARVPEKEVTIRATASAWIEVTRADGEVLVTKLMRDGDELVLPTNDELFLSTGNAGGLSLQMLNMSTFDAGQTGEILRDLRLDRESLLTRKTQLTY